MKKAMLSSKKWKNIPLNSIEIQNKIDGAPIVILNDDIGSSDNIQVSISHTDDYATATAIIEIK